MKRTVFIFVLFCFSSFNLFAQKVEGKSKPGAVDITAEKTPNQYLKANVQRWAVLVGVSQYKNTDKGITSLRYADADAKAMYDFLKSPQGGAFPSSNMRLLTNKDATLPNIAEAINVFLGKAIEDDIVVIFFAGHGSPDPSNPKNLFLLTYDTDPAKMASTGYLMDDLKRALDRFIKARHVLIFVDACHSAGVSGEYATRGKEEEGIFNRYMLNLVTSENSTLIFMASEANELSQESKKWGGGHGIFTWSMLEGMKGEADGFNTGTKDGMVTLGELIDYTMDKVRRETGSQQHPDKSGTRFDRNLPISVLKPELWR